jgi:hypothetical protein
MQHFAPGGQPVASKHLLGRDVDPGSSASADSSVARALARPARNFAEVRWCRGLSKSTNSRQA